MTADRLVIVHVSTETGWRGGERQVRLLTDGLVRRGHQCIVACPPGSPLFEDRSRAGMAAPLRYACEFDLLAARRLAQLVRESGAQIVHAHTSHAHSLAWLASKIHGVPVVVSRRVDFPVGGNWLSRRKYFAAGIHYIAISHAVKEVLSSTGIGPEKIAVVHSGIDPDRFPRRGQVRDQAAASAYGAPSGVPLVVNVAALTDHKDQSTLLRAMALLRRRVPSFRVVIAGSGELETPLRALCSELGLDDRVLFAGNVSNLAALYSAADLFVMSSHLEGLCTSILDAMSAGLPVVATRTGGIPEIVRDGVNGMLVEPRSPSALATAIEMVLSEPSLQEQFAQEGRATVLREFTQDHMVDGTVEVYRRVLGLG
jgi:L-malate glycosyltransferase